jgi:activating signal cointegrator complex subunit 3
MDFLTWTYYFRRITRNPLYYEIDHTDHGSIQKYLVELIDKTVFELEGSGCIKIEDEFKLQPTFTGSIASLYYIRHQTVKFFNSKLKAGLSIYELLTVMSGCGEYDEVPVRHNEEALNEALANICPYKINRSKLDDPKTKTLLLFQAYFSNLPLPIRDYITDTKLVLDNCIRLLQAMIDMATDKGHLDTVLNLCQLSQMVAQGCWVNESGLLNIPHFSEELIKKLATEDNIKYLCQILKVHKAGCLRSYLKETGYQFGDGEWREMNKCLERIPDVRMSCKLWKFDADLMAPVYRAGMSLRDEDEASLTVHLRRENDEFPLRLEMKKLSKIKDAIWWLIVGNEELNEVYYVKRMFFKKKITRTFQVMLPRGNRILKVFLMSDSYIGIDQIHEFDLESYVTRTPPDFKREDGGEKGEGVQV